MKWLDSGVSFHGPDVLTATPRGELLPLQPSNIDSDFAVMKEVLLMSVSKICVECSM